MNTEAAPTAEKPPEMQRPALSLTTAAPPLPLGALAAALAKAQGRFTSVGKDRDVTVRLKDNKGQYEFKYATLAAIWDVIRGPLSENGLAVVQLASTVENAVRVDTRLLHSSGESLSSVCVMPVLERTPQAVGSAISYARRYALSSLVGVVSDEEDDDGAEAVGAKQAPRRGAPAPKPAPAAPPTSGPADALQRELAALTEAISIAESPAQLEMLAKRLGALPEAEKAKMRVAYTRRLGVLSGGQEPGSQG